MVALVDTVNDPLAHRAEDMVVSLLAQLTRQRPIPTGAALHG